MAALYALAMLFLLGTVNGGGQVELRLVSLVNEGGYLESGGCCDGYSSYCMSECDPYFDICVDNMQGPGLLEESCALGRITTDAVHEGNSVDFGSDIEGTPNPMYFSFDSFNEDGYAIDINIWDHDTNSDDFVETINLYIFFFPDKSAEEAQIIPLNYDGIENQMSVEVRIYCDPDYYTSSCAVHCSPRSDLEGHYGCSENGEKICHPGWTGDSCTEDINECETDPCENGATCINLINAFECACKPGYAGVTCNEITDWCLALSPCQNGGECSNEPDKDTYRCDCPPEFSGYNCEEKYNPCDSQPCQNGGWCDAQTRGGFYCQCWNTGYTGDLCDTPAHGAGTVTVKLISYENPDGKGDNGNCCDGYSVCYSECDPFFKVCLDGPNGSPSVDECSVGSYVTQVFDDQNSIEFGDNFGDVPNQISFPFTRWEGMLIKVDVYDDDSNSNDDFIDYFLRLVEIEPSVRSLEPHTIVLESRTKLTVEVTVSCEHNWQGPFCTDSNP